ncbi:MAG: hypothetical protein ACKO1N_05970 [Erythrobacter sp.]
MLDPGAGFNITIDYYNIEVTDRIGITGQINPNIVNANGLTDAQFLVAQGVAEAADLGAVRYFTNAFDTRTQGFDAVIQHEADTGLGRFNTNLAVNYNKTEVTERRAINGTLASGRVLSNFTPINDVVAGNIEQAVPRWRAVLSSNFRSGIFDATGRVSYFGSYTSFQDPITTGIGPTPSVGINTLAEAQALYPVPFSKRFGAQASVDLEIGVTFADRYRIAVGAQNLFDTLPQRETRNVFTSTGGVANGSIYNDFAPIGQLGGFWYGRVSARF